jgi:energy-coupling factor transporter ATP-binding protein EcfA2
LNYLSDISIKTINCNLLLIGKTGAGKSSFANYLFGVDKFTTGTGAPVTKWEENFQKYSLNISEVQVNVYDSVGLEQNNYDRWMRELNDFLSEKQVIHGNGVLSANDIMHILFYVINGAGARIEPNEVSILAKIYNKYKIPISVVITNCDVATEFQMLGIEKEVINKGIETIRVCSISRKTRGGDKKEQFGKELALKKILAASYEKVGKELSIIVYTQLIDLIEKIQGNFIKKIDDSDISIFKIDDISDSLDNIMGDLDGMLDGLNDISNFLPSAYINYYHFLDNFSMEYRGKDVFEESFKEISNFVDNFDMDNLSLAKRLNKAMEDMEDGNILEKVGAFFTMAFTAISLKSTIKTAINEAFGELVSELSSQLWKIQRS